MTENISGWISICVQMKIKNLFLTNAEFKIDIGVSQALFNWKNFLDSAMPVLNVNYYQSMMMLARGIACFHNPYSIKIAGN